MRRRQRLLVVGIVAALVLLVSWLVDLFGGGSSVEEPRTVRTEPPPPTERPEVPPPSIVVEGRVTDHRDAPIADAEVHLVALDGGARLEADLRTDEDGRFSDDSLTRGNLIYVEVRKPGHPTLRRHPKEAVLGGKTLALELSFPETFDLRGHVKVFGGDAVIGARVSFGDFPATTDDRGRFHIEGIDARILQNDPPRLFARMEGLLDASLDLKLDGRHANFDDIEVVMERR